MTTVETASAPFRVAKGQSETITVYIYQDGVLADPDGSAVTVSIVNVAGTTLQSSTLATRRSTGIYDFSLTPTMTASLDLLTATWGFDVGGVAHSLNHIYEVVGAHLFTVQDARTFGDAALASAATYSTDSLRLARDRIAEEFERITHRAFAQRFKRATLSGRNRSGDGRSLWVDDLDLVTVRTIEERAAGGTTWASATAAVIADTFVVDTGELVHEGNTWPDGRQNLRIGYEYGLSQVPAPIRRAALLVLRAHVVPSDINNRTLSLTDDLGVYRFAAAGERGAWYGIPDADAALDRYHVNVGAIG